MTLALFQVEATKDSPTVFSHGEGGVLDGLTIWCALFQFYYSVEVGVLTHTLRSHPKPFKCSITPRSTKAENLIASVEHEL